MQIRLAFKHMFLEPGKTFAVPTVAGARVRVVDGKVWATTSSSPDDVWLGAGEEYTRRSPASIGASPEKLAHDAPKTQRRGAYADDREKSGNDARPPRHRSTAGEPGYASDRQGPVGRGVERRESERRANEAERSHEQCKR